MVFFATCFFIGTLQPFNLILSITSPSAGYSWSNWIGYKGWTRIMMKLLKVHSRAERPYFPSIARVDSNPLGNKKKMKGINDPNLYKSFIIKREDAFFLWNYARDSLPSWPKNLKSSWSCKINNCRPFSCRRKFTTIKNKSTVKPKTHLYGWYSTDHFYLHLLKQ